MDTESGNAIKPRYWHYWISLLLAVALIPMLRSQHLPLRFDWITLGIAFWFVLAVQSIFVATLLGAIGARRVTWEPFLGRCQKNPSRVAAIIMFFAILAWASSVIKALILTIDVIALLEVAQRQGSVTFRRSMLAILMPAAYLFLGFLMVLAYNCAIVSARFNFTYDPALAAMDRWLMFGHSVSELTHWAVQVFPFSVFRVVELIYFGMFPQIGAAIVVVALAEGKMRALQFVGTILLSYYIALIIFYVAPAQGPYYLCPAHFLRFPSSLESYKVQKTLIVHTLALWRHQSLVHISTDYFIGFPCMHIVQPIIVLWFLRPWKRMVYALAAYDVLLVIAILLLEMHYVADFIAGVVVALLAITITDGSRLRAKASVQISADKTAS